jgi:hypothetical protein
MVFRRYGFRSLRAFAAAGALMGWLANLAMEIPTGNLATKPIATLFNPIDNPYISICIVAGASSAVLFRAIAFWHSKDVGSRK